MNEKMLLLERSIRQELATIDGIFAALEPVVLDATTPQNDCIVVGYRLHNLYNAFESIFRHIARAFENTLEERAGWHVELLRRMQLDLQPIRPAVIDSKAFAKLDELRRFRHLFRSLYTADLDPVRIGVALEKARELRAIWPAQVDGFLESITGLGASTADVP